MCHAPGSEIVGMPKTNGSFEMIVLGQNYHFESEWTLTEFLYLQAIPLLYSDIVPVMNHHGPRSSWRSDISVSGL